jgi:ADP-ribose pyrophosphatase YjhB (NUDIX family)
MVDLEADAPNAASVALVRGGEVLLIRRAFAPLQGLWTLPGGRRELDETIEETAHRELAEELALGVGRLQPVLRMGVAGRFRLQVFATRAFAGEVMPSPEIAGWRWVRPESIAELPTTPGLDRVLARAFAVLGAEPGAQSR